MFKRLDDGHECSETNLAIRIIMHVLLAQFLAFFGPVNRDKKWITYDNPVRKKRSAL
ncbi:hypothetical protein X777_07153 [Ooceraea biroi]|uniref:Uncharacterized protein n=1 Tax=Ooceraea biroi TaxID=2015173 RepID=A0A026WBE2_OOCBI|nr:hypothetical protein X777_07153 [Ooceraea biroi]